MTRAMAATAPRMIGGGRALPSGYPSAHAKPALVVAIAAAPHSSTRRALAASHAFGSTRTRPGVWSSRKAVDAETFVVTATPFWSTAITWAAGALAVFGRGRRTSSGHGTAARTLTGMHVPGD